MDKDLFKALEVLDETNPYASFLNNSALSKVDKWFSTGSYVLDAIISGKFVGGGVPSGRLTMLYGESQTYKSSLVLKILANAQKEGIVPVIFDTETAIDEESAKRFGLDTSKVKYIPTFNIEKCRNDIYKFLTTVKEKGLEGKFIIAVDSLGNLESAMEISRMEKESTSPDMGSKARAIGSLLRTCNHLAGPTKTAIIMTNHLYDNPGELHPTLVKNMPGGKKCVYLPSVSVQLMRKPVKADAVKSDFAGELAAGQRNYVGIVIRALTAKNRFIKQYLEGELFISFANGADKYHGLLELAVELGVVQSAGATYSFNGEKLGYAKTFISNASFWDKVIPLMQEKINTEWSYSSEQDKEIRRMELEAEMEGGDPINE